MKRFPFVLVVTGILALTSSPPAGAVPPGLCGHSYAMLMTGTFPTAIQQDGTATQPGALTHAVGVGVITFAAASVPTATGCKVASGELIYNAGDVQTSPNGEFFGPAHCYDGDTIVGHGVPCFDGTNHFGSDGSLSPSPFGNGALSLAFSASYAWFDNNILSGAKSFVFTVQNSLGSSTVVGTSVALPGAPILTLTMQKIGVTPVGTTLGVAPYLGESSISCQSWGANQTDSTSSSLNPPGIAGGASSAVGQTVIFPAADYVGPNPIFADGGGSISFNSNDNIVTSGTPPSNNDCAIAIQPGTNFSPQYPFPTFAFPDGTSNTVVNFFAGADCSNITPTTIVQFVNSAVQWSPTDSNSYLTTAALGANANGFIPPGNEMTCTTYYAAAAGELHSVVTPITLTTPKPGAKSATIKLTNTSPADCPVDFAFVGAKTDGICTLSVTPSTEVPGDGVSTAAAATCTCGATPDTTGFSATLELISMVCPVIGTTMPIITCRN
jgi:hypothetical protein